MGVLVGPGSAGAHSCFAFLSRLLHAEKPGAPVEEDDSNLDQDTALAREQRGRGETRWRSRIGGLSGIIDGKMKGKMKNVNRGKR